jgi:DNA-binding PadR family transcriptional regulator
MAKKSPILVASPVGEIGYALLVSFDRDKASSIPEVMSRIEDETSETLKLATVYDQVKQYVSKGFLKPAGVKKSPETGRNVDLYRITDDGREVIEVKRAQMMALLALFAKVTA